MRDGSSLNSGQDLTFSVIIPSFNEEQYIGATLEALLAQDFDPERYEIIVVDNGSADRTVEIARSITPKVYVRDGSVASLRNFGASHATGDVFAFLDADCVPTASWLRTAEKLIREKGCVTGSPVQPPKECDWISRLWFRRRFKGQAQLPYINSGNLFVPRAVFDKIDGFNERLRTGEDAELGLRARKVSPIIADSRLKVVHYGTPIGMRQFLNREIWHGLGAFGTFGLDWRDKPLLCTFAFMVLTVAQLCGLGSLLLRGSPAVLAAATLGICALLAAGVYHRRKIVRTATDALQLAALYYLFFLGRSISIGYIALGKNRIRQRAPNSLANNSAQHSREDSGITRYSGRRSKDSACALELSA